MDDIYNLMLDETRQNFFQLENLMSNLDMKAFGIIAVNAIMFSWDKFQSFWFFIPLCFLIISSALLIICVWPRIWDRQSSEATIKEYGTLTPEKASSQLTVNYATWESYLTEIYEKKIKHLRNGLIVTTLAFILGVFIIIFLVFCY